VLRVIMGERRMPRAGLTKKSKAKAKRRGAGPAPTARAATVGPASGQQPAVTRD
jgi:hypothetical protein